MVVILAASLIEMIGCSFLLPSAACDLDLPDNLRGIMASIPNIGKLMYLLNKTYDVAHKL